MRTFTKYLSKFSGILFLLFLLGIWVLISCGPEWDSQYLFPSPKAILKALFDGNTDGLGDMGFPKTGTAKEEQRVERGFTGRHGDAFSGAYAQFVALPFHQVAKAIDRVQARVDLEPLQAREHEGTGFSCRLVSGNRNGIVGGGRCRAGGQHHPFLLNGAHQVEQLAIRSDGALDGEPEQLFVRILYILAEEIRGNLYGELGSFQGHRPDELEPGIELLRINVVLNDL